MYEIPEITKIIYRIADIANCYVRLNSGGTEATFTKCGKSITYNVELLIAITAMNGGINEIARVLFQEQV